MYIVQYLHFQEYSKVQLYDVQQALISTCDSDILMFGCNHTHVFHKLENFTSYNQTTHLNWMSFLRITKTIYSELIPKPGVQLIPTN